METNIVTGDGVRLFCRVKGEGEPIVMIHGAMVDADFYDGMQEILSARMKVVSYDRRGYSRSEKASDYSIERQARDAAEIIDSLCGGRAYVLGCSAGSLIAMKLAELYPEMVRHLYIHEAPAVYYDEILKEDEKIWLTDIYETAVSGKISRAVIKFILGLPGAPGPDPRAKSYTTEAADRQMRNGDIYMTYEYTEAFRLEPDYFDFERLKKTCQITGLAGDSSGDTYCVRATRLVMDKLGGKMYYVPGRHNGARDLPGEFASLLLGLTALEL